MPAGGTSNGIAAFFLAHLTDEERAKLQRNLSAVELQQLTEKIETILANPVKVQPALLRDPDIGTDGTLDVNSILRKEFEEIFRGTLYVTNPEELIKRASNAAPGVFVRIRDLFGHDEFQALTKAVEPDRRKRTRHEEAVLADGLRRITMALNDPATFRPEELHALIETGCVGNLSDMEPYNHDESPDGEAPRAPVNPHLIAALARTQRNALCLSGGGIRSATFNLGLVQGLAQNGLLHHFDYLSTVSGGGFIGSWLSAWIHRNPGDVHEHLKKQPDAEEVRYLRAYSNYLAPKTGLLSADTWVIVATYLRNLTVTWLTFIPCLLTALLVPRAVYALTFGDSFNRYLGPDLLTVLAATGLAFVGIAHISQNLPSIRAKTATEPADIKNAQRTFVLVSLLPMVVSSWLFSKVIWLYGETLHLPQITVFTASIVFAGWLPGALKLNGRIPSKNLAFITFVLIPGAAGISGAVAYVPLHWLANHQNFGNALYVSLAPPMILISMLLTGTLIAAIVSRATGLEDEEWWARAGAYFLISIVVWAGFSIICLYAPEYLNIFASISELTGSPKALLTNWGAWLKVIAHAAGIAATAVAVLTGRSSKTGGQGAAPKGSGVSSDVWINTLSALAVGYLFVVLNLILDRMLLRMVPMFLQQQDLAPKDHFAIVAESTMIIILLAAIAFAVVLVLTQLSVNGNKFTPHYFYRNRIIRAYLGASRKRQPDPFTGLDEDDNLAMYELRNQRPFHVINMALNLVGSGRLAWQERKAESFTATPLYSGSLWLGYRDSELYGGFDSHRRKPISLGTAVAVSGAAVSPNMGYMLNSAAAQFLLAMFAVRLGVWLGNPGKCGDRTYARSAPRSSLIPILKEALGLTDEKSSYVYLSDGGHFENLGLYEMVMRGCSQIIVSDASTDGSYDFESLAVSIRKIRIDFGISIDFETFGPIGHSDDELGQYYAVGRIRYSDIDAGTPDGFLLYFKASMRGGEPRDVIQYGTAHPSFPQQTIADQFFTESQFESYRELAFHMMKKISENNAAKTLASFIAGAESNLSKQASSLKKLVTTALTKAAHG
jgi:hypothetical protein